VRPQLADDRRFELGVAFREFCGAPRLWHEGSSVSRDEHVNPFCRDLALIVETNDGADDY